MNKYTKEEEKMMIKFHQSLDEASKRRYAAIESNKLGHGGKKYIKELLGTSYDSISKGIKELREIDLNKDKRIRRKGGGSKGKKTIV